jgi:hypothetical protein
MKNLLWLTSFRGESPATVAQIYGINGWQIFPCIGKQPATRTGFNAASADPDQIADWWRQFPEANIGWSLPKGWFALDVDPRHGGDESLAAIYAQNRDAVPFTLEARTGSGGRHLIFRVPDGIEIRQGANFRPGLDTRLGGRGYLLIAPSVHPETKAAYEWTVLVEPQAPPRWLVDLVRVPLAKPRETIANVGSLPVAEMDKRQRYARAVLSGLCEEVRRAGKGQRNDTLNRAWYRIGSFRDAISKAEAREALLSAALDCGLSERESAMVLR